MKSSPFALVFVLGVTAFAVSVAIVAAPSAEAQCRASATSCLGSDIGEYEYVTESSFVRTCSTMPSMVVEQNAPAGRLRADKLGPGDGAAAIQDDVQNDWIRFEPGNGSGRANVPPGTVLEISIACEVDQPFFLQAWILVTGLGLGEVHAESRLLFERLPEGATIESCKGYRQTTAVPARSASWGRLKASYR